MSDETTDPREMLRLMEATRRRTAQHLTRRYTLLLVLWAFAWALGFGALYVTDGVGAHPLLPQPTGWIVFGVAIVAAVLISMAVGIGASRDGIRGRSQLQGMLYGFSWTISMFAAWLFLSGLQRAGLPDPLAQLAYPGLYVFLVGVLYLAGGAVFRTVPMYLLGVGLILTTIVATFLGAPAHYLVYATVAPAAMLVVAGLLLWGPLQPTSGEES